ncbi:unnamed protein product [Triticum turgidum subsp. durum]|uniref:Polyprotein n=1 Tax=Triticum turgidum subsp. durum TaxID=4567 RepID=A0A9R0WEW8_TRITD|nr:unnamed protein product [Triticum turgidum subsp. durum]
MDQLSAYEPNPDMMHYTTRFIDGLKPAARVIVAVQRPPDLDTAYCIASMQEEVGDGETELNSSRYSRQPSSSSSSRQYKAKPPDELREPNVKPTQADDKLATLKAYRRAKGLCCICGERWGRDHKCNATVQLHVVQEMLEFCDLTSPDSDDSADDLMVLSTEAQSDKSEPSAIKLSCQLQGEWFVFLLDSGSSHSFLSAKAAAIVPGHKLLARKQQVRVAGGGHLECTHMIPKCSWSADGYKFKSDFKILPLQFYDGIICMD